MEEDHEEVWDAVFFFLPFINISVCKVSMFKAR